ncbi:hypothetical protein, partial [Thiolapillus sp.]
KEKQSDQHHPQIRAQTEKRPGYGQDCHQKEKHYRGKQRRQCSHSSRYDTDQKKSQEQLIRHRFRGEQQQP